MRYRLFTFLLLFIPLYTVAKTVYVKSADDLFRNTDIDGCRFVIKADIDLKGSTVFFSPKSSLIFRDGSFLNGILIGSKTYIRPTSRNIFHNCTIKGEWDLRYAISSMFDETVETIQLLHNLSTLSSIVKLSNERNYLITANNEQIKVETIEGIGNKKPIIKFHTENPDVPGISIKGDNILLKNLIIEDDYQIDNDVKYGDNNTLIGNTVTILANNLFVSSLTIENCDFKGGTSSSFVASSQVKNCRIIGSSFSGYISDHAVYCSMNVETYIVKDCIINNVTHGNGLFKVRTSKGLRSFIIKNVYANNLNGYMVEVALQNTPSAKLRFEDITVTKDDNNTSIFYGFCIVDETRIMAGNGYNACELFFNNCRFDYGYNNNAFVYQGSAKRACIKNICYNHMNVIGSNFGGGYSDGIIVKNSSFIDFLGAQAIDLQTNSLILDNINLSAKSDKGINAIFLVNYYDKELQSISLNKVKFDLQSTFLIQVVRGDGMDMTMSNCYLSKAIDNLINTPSNYSLNLREKRNIYDTPYRNKTTKKYNK